MPKRYAGVFRGPLNRRKTLLPYDGSCRFVRVFVFAASVTAFSIAIISTTPVRALEPIPDRLVVLTFDDSVKSHFTVVRPILLKHKFRATFFITEGFNFKDDKEHYMTWDEIAHLHRDGFEIGNHTRDHMSVNRQNLSRLKEQVEAINDRCAEFGLPHNNRLRLSGQWNRSLGVADSQVAGVQVCASRRLTRVSVQGRAGFAYEPGLDHPLLVPSTGDARPSWTLEDFKRAVNQAQIGRIAVLQFHGVPDLAHPWVHSPVERFEEYMNYLDDNHFRAIALGDLERYVDPANVPSSPQGVIEDRSRSLDRKTPRENFRPPKGEADLRRWLANMVWYHRFTVPEMRGATGLSEEAIKAALARLAIRPETRPSRPSNAPLLVLPYPGGRHPRVGFWTGQFVRNERPS